jgi:hypothetical protein
MTRWLSRFTHRFPVTIEVIQQTWPTAWNPYKVAMEPIRWLYDYSETPILASDVKGNPDFFGEELEDPQISENWFVQSRLVWREVLPKARCGRRYDQDHWPIVENMVCTSLDGSQRFDVCAQVDDEGSLLSDVLWLNVALQSGENHFYVYYEEAQ